MAAVRVRQHVNPLTHKYQKAIAPPDWTVIYPNLTQPLHLDIGSAKGYFLLSMAQIQADWNFLGLEIREALVEECHQRRDELGLTNLHYLFANANTSLLPILESLPAGILQRVSIQFPDPWFKKRHQKRRVVQREMVAWLANYLTMGGEVFVQSDVIEVAVQMCEMFGSHPAFGRTSSDWLPVNPLPVSTERENSTLSRNQLVYRALFKKQI